MLLFAKLEPYLPRLHKEVSPTILQNAEWMAGKCPTANMRLELVRKRVAGMMMAAKA